MKNKAIILPKVPYKRQLILTNTTKRVLTFEHVLEIDPVEGTEKLSIYIKENKKWWEFWK